MKPKLIFTLLFFISLSLFRFTNTTKETLINPPAPPGNNEFITCVMGSGYDLDYDNMNSLNQNLWHTYTEHNLGWTEISNDTPEEDPVNYFDAIVDRIDSNYNVGGMFSYNDRPKFQRLVFGQRSDYQCELEANIQNDDFWFYTYNTHSVGSDVTDGDAIVRHCSGIEDGPGAGWVCKDLKANREQCNRFWNYEQRDEAYPWLVKPKIRIPSSAPTNTPDKRVCRIEALDWDGNMVDSFTIFAKNFKNQITSYSGQYLEEYFWNPLSSDPASPKKISDYGWILNPNSEWFADWGANCQVDFRVWWYDEVEMWIDYVRVDNQKAHDLLEPTGALHSLYEYWIQKEVEIACENPDYVRNFYIEEFEITILPCLRYVNDKIKYWSNYYNVSDPPLSMNVNLNYDLY